MKDILKECIVRKKASYVPIWFMRQAGRYLPEFREIRKKNPDFIKLCLNSNLVKEITDLKKQLSSALNVCSEKESQKVGKSKMCKMSLKGAVLNGTFTPNSQRVLRNALERLRNAS